MRSMVEGIYPTMLAGPPRTVARARKLRRSMAMPEVILWNRLRSRPGGFKFRRQHPAGRYVLNFFCSEARLAIEDDGEIHAMGDRPQGDLNRDAWLTARGVTTLRIVARDVTADPDSVVEGIAAACRERHNPLHQPSAGPPSRSGEER